MGTSFRICLTQCYFCLLEYPGSTLLGIMRMLTDKTFRKKVIAKISDPVVKSFWVEEYSKYPDRFQAEAIAPIQNKVGRFLSSALIRNILGQVKSSFDVREIMDKQKILLLNLSKGRVGEDNSALIGAMMITKIQLAAMSRVDIAEKDRKDFYLYVDEFQNFATESFANILSEARKYRLNLILAHQYIEQLEDRVRAAVFGNVGTLAIFRIGAADAEFLEKEVYPAFTQENLVNLPKYNIYIKLMIDGITSEAFSATTLPPIPIASENIKIKDKVINVSRERYTKSRSIIEDKIMRWSESKAMLEDSKDNKKQKKGHQAKCSFCNIDTTVPFIPDPSRPIFCPKCLKLSKEGKIPPPHSIKKVKVKEKRVGDKKENKEILTSLAQALKKEKEIKEKNKLIEL